MLGDADEAQDVAQETFIRFWSARLLEEDPRRQLAWLYRTCTRLAIDLLRRRRSRPQASDALLESLPGPDAAKTAELRDELARMAQRVPKNELEVALLSRLDRLTHPEIAEVIGTSERSVRRMLSRFDARVVQARSEIAHV